MPKSHFGRPSGAMLVALLALFVALGSGAYAATAINGKIIQKRTIVGSKLKNNTLTGTQINESTLGTVPQATQADSASNATTAAMATKATSATTATTATKATSATNAVNATNATNAVNATNAINATTATNAQQLGGIAANSYLHGFHLEADVLSNALATKTVKTSCPSGEVAVGGGAANTAATGKVVYDKLQLTATSYEVTAFLLPGQTESFWGVEAAVMCAIP